MNTELLETLDKAVELLRAEYQELQQERGAEFSRGHKERVNRLEEIMQAIKGTYFTIEELQLELCPDLYLEP